MPEIRIRANNFYAGAQLPCPAVANRNDPAFHSFLSRFIQ
jgi:hypothetical protein